MIYSLEATKEEKGHCGNIRRLLSDEQNRFVHVRINDAEKHFHKITTEYYYVLKGEGRISLDNEIFQIKKGDLIKIRPGIKHQAFSDNGELEVLVIESPPAINDCHY